MKAVRRGYAAFNARDVETMASLMCRDVVQHVVGSGSLTGDHKGIESVLGCTRSRLPVTVSPRVSRGSILFTLVGDKITDMLELRSDLPGDDAFLG